MSEILGIDHIGIGISNMAAMKSFYHGTLEFTNIFGEMPQDDHKQIHDLLRMCPTIHSAIQINQACGGIAVAMFNHVYPKPRPIRKHMRYGDIGICKISIAVANLNQFYDSYKDKLNFCTELHRVTIPGWGDHAYIYARDPEGNFVEFIDGNEFSVKDKFGGVRWIGISVTELERSMEFYKKYLGFDKTVINVHESFSGNIDEISGTSQTIIRSCLLANSKGNGMVELSEFIKPRGRSIPFCTNWGDFGFLQLCLLGDDINSIKDRIIKEDLDLILTPQAIEDNDPENTGLSFLYTRDPDGIPIEVMVHPRRNT